MRNQIATRGLPALLVLMGVAVILIITGAGSVGFTFGLVVALTAGAFLVASVLYEVANSGNRDRRRGPHARGF